MIRKLKGRLLLPLLAVGMTLAMAAPAQAQYRQMQQGSGTSASIQITFGSAPHWTPVYGSRVRMVRESERPDYDMFNYGGRYYIYQGDRWYTCRRPQGRFVYIEERYVPMSVSRVPRKHWRNYPGQWDDHSRDPRRGHGRGNGHGNGNGRR